MSVRAVCARCGGLRETLWEPCPDCGATVTADERPLAWLLSAAWLDPEELAETARRISGGQRPDPGRKLLDGARVALGEGALASGPGLSRLERAGTLGANLLLTPLAGFAVWFGLREERPRAAREALMLTLPVTAALALLWVGVVFFGR